MDTLNNRQNEKKEREHQSNVIKWALACSMGAALLLFIWIGSGIWKEYRDMIMDTQKEQMLVTVESISESMEMFIGFCESDLNGLYEMTKENWAEEGTADWSVLKDFLDTHSSYVYDIVAFDQSGRILSSEKNVRIKEMYSKNRMSETCSLIQAKLDNDKQYWILKKDLGTDGSLAMMIDGEWYYQSLISDLQIGNNGYVVIKDSDGVILMHPEQQQWGIEVIEGRMEMYPDLDLESLNAMIEEQKKGKKGVADYYSYWWMKPELPRVRKIAAYAPAKMGDSFMIVSAVMDYDDIYIPIAEGVQRLIFLFLILLLGLAALTYLLVRALWQKERATEEVTYLTELNHLLEEMHQSEETIAHQQRLQIMGTVTGGIAHEFNNLLTPIMGYADLLMLELPEGSGAYDSAVEIYEASEKAKEIIQQISSLSRKNMETVYKNIHASRILKRALKMTGSVCPPNITITEDIHLEDVWILCNETQMNQMILNICVNAIHAIGHKEGDIRIQADVASREEVERRHGFVISNTWNRYVRIMISDNGCGMSEEVLKQIFDPFFTTKKGGTGTGLGLSLVEQIIHSHRGFIFAESQLEKGSTFFLYLPVNEQKEEEFYQAADGAPIRQLLIVDDNPKILKLLEKEGAKRKLTVVWRMTLEEAMEQLSTGNFQAFVVDQTVNELSGVDFCMSIQGKWPGLPKIIMADQTTKELVEAKQRGLIQGYLNKPVSMTEILKVLEEGNLNKL